MTFSAPSTMKITKKVEVQYRFCTCAVVVSTDSADREASLIKKEYCGCGPHPLQVTSSRVTPPLVKGAGHIGPFSQTSGVGHSGSWPPLHCGDPKTLHWRLFLAPHCTLRLSHLSVGGNTRRLWASSTCRSQALGTIGADCSRVARATTPGPPPQPHGWVRLGFEVSRFPHFWRGAWHVLGFLGVWSLGLFSSVFSPHP